MLLLAGLTIDLEPAVPLRGPPTPDAADSGREALQQLRAARASPSGWARIRLDQRDLDGLATLAGDSIGLNRAEAAIRGTELVGATSLALPLGAWANLSVALSRGRGAPAMALTIGRLRLPAWASGPALALAETLLDRRGAQLAGIRSAIRRIVIEPGEVIADLAFPPRDDFAAEMIRLSGDEISRPAVAAIYCRLAAAADPSFAAQVNRAFAGSSGDAVAHNRAALVALAMLALGEEPRTLAATCVRPTTTLTLGGRDDLAKHWALSAALTAAVGTDIAGKLGEWKELSDSSGSSGFSFVDLAADRAGARAARLAADPATAAGTAARLAVAQEAQLLPPPLLQGQENLSDADFAARYGTVRSGSYQAAVAAIDRQLDRLSGW